MFNVIFEEKVIYYIDNFVDSYRNIFLNRFIDTGVFNENLIRKSYIELSKEFRNNIYDEIKTILKQEQILGRMTLQEDFSIFINIGNYRAFLIYSENIEEKMRFVEDITFYKK